MFITVGLETAFSSRYRWGLLFLWGWGLGLACRDLLNESFIEREVCVLSLKSSAYKKLGNAEDLILPLRRSVDGDDVVIGNF